MAKNKISEVFEILSVMTDNVERRTDVPEIANAVAGFGLSLLLHMGGSQDHATLMYKGVAQHGNGGVRNYYKENITYNKNIRRLLEIVEETK